jgi:hypothetical protein
MYWLVASVLIVVPVGTTMRYVSIREKLRVPVGWSLDVSRQ